MKAERGERRRQSRGRGIDPGSEGAAAGGLFISTKIKLTSPLELAPGERRPERSRAYDSSLTNPN